MGCLFYEQAIYILTILIYAIHNNIYKYKSEKERSDNYNYQKLFKNDFG